MPATVGAWFITFRNPQQQSDGRCNVIAKAERDKSRPYGWRHCPLYTNPYSEKKISQTHVMNKFNKKAILSMRTVDICRWVGVRCQKTLIFGITFKILIISLIDCFDANKNKNQFQEPPFLESKSAASCRWNRCFLHQEPSLFEIKSAEWSSFLLSSVFKDAALCHADLANYQFWFSISLKIAKIIFLYNISSSG